MYKQGTTGLVPLKPPAKVLKMHGQKIEYWYEIMLSETRLTIFGDNNLILHNVK